MTNAYVYLSVPGTTLKSAERILLLTALNKCNGSAKNAAQILGITPRVMSYKMKCHQIASRRRVVEVAQAAEDEH